MRRTTIAAVVLAVLPAALLAAATFIVTNTNDGGPGSLREAIEQANAQPGPHQIRVNNNGDNVMTFRPFTPLPRIERDTDVFSCCRLDARKLNTIIDGALMTGSGYAGLRLGDHVTVEGLIVSGFRDGAGGAAGIRMEGTGSQITHTYVGTDGAGTGANGNDTGVEITGSDNSVGYDFDDDRHNPAVNNNLIGGSEAGAPNVISGNRSSAVIIGSGSVGNRVERNRIGPNAAGTAVLGNGDEGILIEGSYNVIQANTIRGSGTYGISVFDGAFNQFWRNSISGSGQLGVDLGFDGVTANDPLDADDGPNGLQNFPVLTSVVPGTTVSGTMPGAPNRDLMLEFFASPAAHATGFGEGQRFIGSRTVTTDATGTASFTFTLPGAVAGGEVVSATATDTSGNTSEFSAARAAVEPSFRGTALAVDVTGKGVLDPGEAAPW